MHARALQAAATAAAQAEAPDAPAVNMLDRCTTLLANMTERERRKHMSGDFRDKPAGAQLAHFHKAIRGQEFIARQAHAVESHDAWVDQQFREQMAKLNKHKPATAQEKEAFYQRLLKDTAERASSQATAKAERIAMDAKALQASKLYAISPKLCRRPVA